MGRNNSDDKTNWWDKGVNKDRERIFERKRWNKCHVCGNGLHLMASYPKRQRDRTKIKKFKSINHLGYINEDKDLFEPFLSESRINGKKGPYSEIRDRHMTSLHGNL